MFDAQLSPIHGGSIIGFIAHAGRRRRPSDRLAALRQAEIAAGSNELATYRAFAERVKRHKQRDTGLPGVGPRRGASGFSAWAPGEGKYAAELLRVGPRHIACLVEKNALRRGLFSPGMHIPVVMEDELPAPPAIYYVLAWNFKDEILARSRQLLDHGVEFYFPSIRRRKPGARGEG